MANTIDAALVNKVLAQKAITKIQHALAWLPQFSTDFSDEVRDNRSRVIQVPVANASSAVQVNPTNFETGDTTLALATVTMDHISKSFYLTSADIGTGSRLDALAAYNMQIVTNEIERKVFALVTEANFPTPALTGLTAGAFSGANAKTLWGATPGVGKILMLKDNEFANLLPSDLNGYDITKSRSGFGYDYIGNTGNGFAAAGTKLVGFGATKGAFAIASAIPAYAPQVAELLDSQVVEVPELGGLTIQSNIWASAGSRNLWASYDVLFGAAVGDAAALKLAKLV